MLLRSRALELTLDGCLSEPLDPHQEGELGQLLSAFLPGAPGAPVAAAVARLAALLAEDAHSYDTQSAAQRAVQDVVAALKAAAAGGGGGAARAGQGGVLEAWTGRLATLDKEMGRAAASLSAMEQQSAPIAK